MHVLAFPLDIFDNQFCNNKGEEVKQGNFMAFMPTQSGANLFFFGIVYCARLLFRALPAAVGLELSLQIRYIMPLSKEPLWQSSGSLSLYCISGRSQWMGCCVFAILLLRLGCA